MVRVNARAGEWILQWAVQSKLVLLAAVFSVAAPMQGAEAAPPLPKGASLAHFVEQPDETLFDVYLGDKYQGLVLTTYGKDFCTISDVRAVIDQLPKLKSETEIIQLLTDSFPKERSIEGVGTVKCDTTTFRILIELRGDFLIGRSIDLTHRLPPPQDVFSLRQDVKLTYAGDLASQDTGSAALRTLVSFGSTWLDWDGTVVESDKYDLARGALASVADDMRYRAGYLRSPGQTFLGSADILGVSAESAEEVFLNEEALRGSRVEIFVPSRSRVEFFRGGILLDTQYLDFGLQEIDTSRFPQGSYEIEAVVTEDSGRVSRERRFFTKSGLLSIRGRPLYSGLLGVSRDRFDLTDTFVYQGDARWRVTDFLDAKIGVGGTDKTSTGFAQFTFLYDQTILDFGLAHSTRNRSGLSIGVSTSLLGFNVSGSFTGTLNPDESIVDTLVAPVVPVNGIPDRFRPSIPTSLGAENIDVLSRKRTSMQGAIYRKIGFLDLRMSAQRSEFGDDGTKFAWGPSAIFHLIQRPRHSLDLSASWFRTDEGEQRGGGLYYQYRLAPWSVSLDSQVSRRSSADQDRSRVDLAYNNVSRARLGEKVSASIDTISQTRSDESTDQNIGTIEAEIYRTAISAAGFYRNSKGRGDTVQDLGLKADTSITLGEDLKPEFSRGISEDAVAIVAVDSISTEAFVEILVNGSVYDQVAAGTTVALGLQPYRKYEIAIRPVEGGELTRYDSNSREVVLFPGNVAKERFAIDKVYIALGRILGPNGEPIGRKRILGALDYTVTDVDGTFQTELAGSEVLRVKFDGKECTIQLPQIVAPQYLHDYGDVHCLHAPMSAEEPTIQSENSTPN